MNEPTPDNQRRTRLRNVVSDERSSSDRAEIDRECNPERDAVRDQESDVAEGHRNIVNNGRDDAVDSAEERQSREDDNGLDQELSEPNPTEELREPDRFYSMSENSEDHDDKMDTLQRLTRPLKRQREGTSSEDDIPLAELSRRLKRRNTNQEEIEDMMSEDDIPLAELSKRVRPSTSGLGEIEAIKRLRDTLVEGAK